eukprot:g20285.t1
MVMNCTGAMKRSASAAELPRSPTDLGTREREDEGYYGGGGGNRRGGGGGGPEITGRSRGMIHDDDPDDQEDECWRSSEDEDDEYEGEEDHQTTFAACTSALGRSLLCGAFARCVDPLTWVAEDEHIDAAVYDWGPLLSGPRRHHRSRRRRRRGHDRADNANDSESDNANDSESKSASPSPSPSPSAATETGSGDLELAAAGFWTDIDLNASTRGDGDGDDDDDDDDNDDNFTLYPRAVASSPFLRIAPDTDVFRCTAVTALTGSLRVSPLAVRQSGSAPCRARPARSFFLEDGDRPRHQSDASPLTSDGGDGGGAPAAPRAPRNGGGAACVPEGNKTGGAAGGSGSGSGSTPGGGPPASPSADEGAGAGGAKVGGSNQKKIKKGGGDGPRRRSCCAVDMAVEPLHEEYDFEGRPTQLEKPMDSPFAAAFSAPPGEDDEQHLVFLDLLEGEGQPLRNLTARVRFSVSPGRRVDRDVGPLQAATNGRVYGTVQYPSMKDLWPDVSNTPAVTAVEVDLMVEVRSLPRKALHLRAKLKVMYRREKVGRSKGASWRP